MILPTCNVGDCFLFKIKSTEVHSTTELSPLFKTFVKLHCHAYVFISTKQSICRFSFSQLLGISQNSSAKCSLISRATLPLHENLERGFGHICACLFLVTILGQSVCQMRCHVYMECNPWLETWYVAILYPGGTKICVTVQWMSADHMTLSPAKLKYIIWTAVVKSHVTGELPKTKLKNGQTLSVFHCLHGWSLKYRQCTSASLLCYKSKQIFNCI